MSQKLRMPQGLEAVYLCRVKNLGDKRTKDVRLRADIYEKLRKEMHIEILETVKPAGVAWEVHQRQIASQKGKPKPAKPAPAPAPVVGDIPEPPVNNHERLPDEDDHEFRVRRMQEGKAHKAWERKYGAAAAAAEGQDPIKEALEAQGLEDLLNSK